MNMMTELKTMIVVALVAAAMIGCTDDDTPTAAEKFMSQLHGQWTLSGGSVHLDNMDVTGAFGQKLFGVGSCRSDVAAAGNICIDQERCGSV
jgi:hypothetical protein